MIERTLGDRISRRVGEALRYQGHSLVADKALAVFVKEVLVEVALDAPDDKLAPGIKAMELLKDHMPSDYKLSLAKRVLHNAMFKAWLDSEKKYNGTEEKSLESELASALLGQPSYTGPSPATVQWEEAVDTAMRACFDAEKLKRLLVVAKGRGKNTLRIKALHRLVELMEPDKQEFVGDCVLALGDNPNSLRLVAKDAVDYIARMTQLAQWSFEFVFCFPGVEVQETTVEHPSIIRVKAKRLYPREDPRQIYLLGEQIERQLQAQWAKKRGKGGGFCQILLDIEGIDTRRIDLSA